MDLITKQAKKVYGDYVALNSLDLSLKRGGAYALLGGNGAGKSTLIKCIMNLVALSSGSIDVQGRCAFLPEQPYLPESMTAWQMVSHACRMQGQDRECVISLLTEVKLQENVWHKRISSYSKGMRQRTALSYTLAGNPEWLILDEPMSGLDAMGRSLVIDILRKRNEAGVGILMCSHLVADIVKLCTEVFVIVQGEIKETIRVQESSMKQADILETRLKFWSGDAILD
ncbi:MAG: ABC transporter ATP-binding protein [Ghiorsea sp.]